MSRRAAIALAGALLPSAASAQPAEVAPPRITFEDAVRRAMEATPAVGEATQAVRRAEALLADARTVFHPTLDATYGTTVLDNARGFDGMVTQPRTQSAFGATLSYAVLAPSRWAARTQAADQVGVARLSAEETRRDVAVTAARAFLGVVGARRQVEIAVRNRETAAALAEYARVRLEAGQGSRLNHVRASQELAASEGRVQAAELALRAAREALGVAVFAEGPLDAEGEPRLDVPSAPAGDEWLDARPDVRLYSARAAAADRVLSDTWKSWLPTATAAFSPRYVTPAGLFEPARTWRAFLQLEVPLYDGSLGAARRLRAAERDAAQLRLSDARLRARSELRLAEHAVARTRAIVETSRRSAEAAAEALRITEIAYRAGATTNIEVVQAQQTARNAETALALAEDQHRHAQLDLLVALGKFPG